MVYEGYEYQEDQTWPEQDSGWYGYYQDDTTQNGHEENQDTPQETKTEEPESDPKLSKAIWSQLKNNGERS